MDKELQTVQVLSFQVQGISACIDLQHINKVVLLPSLEPLPNSAPYLAGLMNFSGMSIPVIDLALRVKIKRSEKYTLETPVLLCDRESEQVGIIVDKINGITTISKEEIQMQDEFNQSDSAFIGTAILDSKLTYVINLHNVTSSNQISTDRKFISGETRENI